MSKKSISRENAAKFELAASMFHSVREQYRILSSKKPDATLSSLKVEKLNLVLTDLLSLMEGEPSAKYLASVDDDLLPQYSDIVLIMAQFKAAMTQFADTHKGYGYDADWNFEDEDEVEYEDEDEDLDEG
jgi:hypothetical protein